MSKVSPPKHKIKILLLEGVHDSAVRTLKDQGYNNIEYLKTSLTEAELTEKVVDQEGMILRFWKDPIEVSNGDGMHPEPHEHNYLPDWKTKKVRYPDFTIIIPKGYECKEWQ